jgi:uncharacterized protein
MMNDNIANPFAKPLYVMLKPAGAHCNLACKYCYYLEKNKLYPTAQRHLMSDEMLEQFTREYIEAQTMNQVLFTWHGGEPLLRSIDFYRKALSLQQKYAGGRRIDNVIQTNGTLLTDEWCEFFAQNHWLVGISIDGPQPDHDHYRLTAAGKPSWKKVMQGIKLLKKHGVEWNAMAVVNAYNVNHPLEFYRFFKENGCQFLQFTPIVERQTRHEDGRTLAMMILANSGILILFIFVKLLFACKGTIFLTFFQVFCCFFRICHAYCTTFMMFEGGRCAMSSCFI